MSEPVDHRITVRLTGDEYLRLCDLAGAAPLSRYMREAALGAKAKRKPTQARRVADKAALAQALALLGQTELYASLRRLSKAADLGALPLDDETRAQLTASFATVEALRLLLLAALGRWP